MLFKTFSISLLPLSWQPIIDYINEQYDKFLRDESGLNRRNIEDHRVHCCLYFINPCGHGLVLLLFTTVVVYYCCC